MAAVGVGMGILAGVREAEYLPAIFQMLGLAMGYAGVCGGGAVIVSKAFEQGVQEVQYQRAAEALEAEEEVKLLEARQADCDGEGHVHPDAEPPVQGT